MELIGGVLTKWGNWRQSPQFWLDWPCRVCGIGGEVIQSLNILVQRGLVVEVKVDVDLVTLCLGSGKGGSGYWIKAKARTSGKNTVYWTISKRKEPSKVKVITWKGGLQKARVALQGGKWQMASDVGQNPLLTVNRASEDRLQAEWKWGGGQGRPAFLNEVGSEGRWREADKRVERLVRYFI